jgi:hypothetical protein
MKKISFSRKEESFQAKAEWFYAKPVKERLLAALEWLDFIRLISSKKVQYEDAHKTFRSVRVLKPRKG